MLYSCPFGYCQDANPQQTSAANASSVTQKSRPDPHRELFRFDGLASSSSMGRQRWPVGALVVAETRIYLVRFREGYDHDRSARQHLFGELFI